MIPGMFRCSEGPTAPEHMRSKSDAFCLFYRHLPELCKISACTLCLLASVKRDGDQPGEFSPVQAGWPERRARKPGTIEPNVLRDGLGPRWSGNHELTGLACRYDGPRRPMLV